MSVGAVLTRTVPLVLVRSDQGERVGLAQWPVEQLLHLSIQIRRHRRYLRHGQGTNAELFDEFHRAQYLTL